MAHKTLIGGTAYEISGGKTLINGTAYSIDKGKTLVGGTAYEVGFDDGMRTVTVNVISSDCAEVEADGQSLDTGTYKFPVGTVIVCWIWDYDNNSDYDGVYLNNICMKSASYRGSANYEYTLTKDVSIFLDSPSGYDEGRIRIYDCPIIYFMGGFEYIMPVQEDGMTWAEWCGGGRVKIPNLYDGYVYVEGDYVKYGSAGTSAITLDGVFVKPTDTIVIGATYNYSKIT